MTEPKLFCKTGQQARTLRKRLGLKQADFWSKIFVTQSGGSHYESLDRDIPTQTLLLLQLVYGTEKQAEALLEWLRKGDRG